MKTWQNARPNGVRNIFDQLMGVKTIGGLARDAGLISKRRAAATTAF
jgi:hypothetical protein